MAAGRRTAWQITARGRESWPSLKALLLSCSMRFSISNGIITQLITHTHKPTEIRERFPLQIASDSNATSAGGAPTKYRN